MSTTMRPRRASPGRTIFRTRSSGAIFTGPASAALSARSGSGSIIGTSAVKSPARPQEVSELRDGVLYRDDWAVVLNKPTGLAVQGGTNTDRHVDALLDGLRFDSTERPRLVHRLDKDTSGVLLIARHAAATAFFTRAFRDRATRKIYWAIVVGVPQLHRGRIDLALAKSGGAGRERVEADEDGKHAVTYYTVVDHAGSRASWLALLQVTGRTHQLRAHCAALDTPIL